MNVEIRSIQKTLYGANEAKLRENNIVLFNLNEHDEKNHDKDAVMEIFKNIKDSSIKNNEVMQIFRQGKKVIGSNKVKFNNSTAKA